MTKSIDTTTFPEELLAQLKVPQVSHSVVNLQCRSSLLRQELLPYIQFGNLSEWGVPLGRMGRYVLLHLFNHLAKPLLWINSHSDLQIYPPAWAAQGIELRSIYYAQSTQPVAQLRPLFLDRAFSLIVLDAPEKLKPSDLAFLQAQARIQQYHLFLLRPYFLTSKKGTPQANLRLNCWLRPERKTFVLRFIKCHAKGGRVYSDLLIPRSEIMHVL